MSRHTALLGSPRPVLGVNVDTIVYGLDHASGYFIQGMLNGNVVFNKDEMFGFSKEKIAETLDSLGFQADASCIAMGISI